MQCIKVMEYHGIASPPLRCFNKCIIAAGIFAKVAAKTMNTTAATAPITTKRRRTTTTTTTTTRTTTTTPATTTTTAAILPCKGKIYPLQAAAARKATRPSFTALALQARSSVSSSTSGPTFEARKNCEAGSSAKNWGENGCSNK